MKILGIDTSTPIGSVALIDDDNLVAEHTLNIVQAHSSRLMPAIDTVLKWGDIAAADLDACAVGVGPGSFTGVRIGVATIKSLCYALDKPIGGVSTLEAVAYNLRWTNGVICPLFDARRSEVYGAIFQGGAEWQRLSEELCLPIDDFLDRLDRSTSPDCLINFVGDGLLTYGDAVVKDWVREPFLRMLFSMCLAVQRLRISAGNVYSTEKVLATGLWCQIMLELGYIESGTF